MKGVNPEVLRVGVSNADLRLLIRLQLEGLMDGALWQEPIYLGVMMELPDGSLVERFTVPEVHWRHFHSHRCSVTTYLDGPPHLKSHVQERDEELRGLLRGLGWTVLEFPYTPPLTDSRLREITESIREALPQ